MGAESPFTRARNCRTEGLRWERQRVEARERANAPLYSPVTTRLLDIVHARGLGDRLTKPILLQLAREMSRDQGIPIDRLARRYRSCVICWFCELWTQRRILPKMPLTHHVDGAGVPARPPIPS
jgi:hypothetical protein